MVEPGTYGDPPFFGLPQGIVIFDRVRLRGMRFSDRFGGGRLLCGKI